MSVTKESLAGITVERRPSGRRARATLVAPEMLRAVDREQRDLVASLRALAALLREPPAHPGLEEPVLARMLEAQLTQLAVLGGELTTALRVGDGEAGPMRRIDLARALQAAASRAGRRVDVMASTAVVVRGHPDVVGQILESALALAARIADGRIGARARRCRTGGLVSLEVPGRLPAVPSWRSRLALLRRIVEAESGRLTIERPRARTILEIELPLAVLGPAPRRG